MGKEIERKFLVRSDFDTSSASECHHIIQSYISVTPEATVRVRIADNDACITIKGKNNGATRSEWEYPIPIDDATHMIEECAQTPVIDKTRYIIDRWEIDIFHRSLDGLRLAEIELKDEKEPIEIPSFIEKEVTGDTRYYNSVLAINGLPS